MADASIEIKGTSVTLSVLHLKTPALTDMRADLTKKIAQAPEFFYLTPILVDIEGADGAVDYQAVKALVEEFNFTFVGFTGTIPKEQRQQIRDLHLPFVNTSRAAASQKKNGLTDNDAHTKTAENVPTQQQYGDRVHRGQVRSGQQIYAKGQNLVVIGSVSAGAEIIADGNIHVYGSLRGRAIAGATGHHLAQIYCQKLEAELVSINGNYWLSESMEQHWGNPVYIQLTGAELTSSKLI